MIKFTHNKLAPMTKKRRALFDSLPFYAKYLRIHKADITVNLVFKYLLRETFSQLAYVEQVTPKRYNLVIDAKIVRVEDSLATIAHEMVHVAQYVKGRLSSDAEGFQLWNGAHVESGLLFHKLPWEREALSKELIMLHAYCETAQT